MTYIDPEAKTFVQRIYIDTRAYTGKTPLNVQIIPKHKREEIDIPSQPPVTIREGVKTAYRTTYQIADPENDANIKAGDFDKILRTYDLSNHNMSLLNTARWRPFDWGFDEDQLNLEKGVYIIDVEGYYDSSLIDGVVTNEVEIDDNYKIKAEGGGDVTDLNKQKPKKVESYDRTKLQKTDPRYLSKDDLGKLDLHVDFYAGAREFEQFTFKDGKEGTDTSVDAAYLLGIAARKAQYKAKLIKEGKTEKEAEAITKEWYESQPAGQKYANYLSKEVTIEGKKYIGGKIIPDLGSPTFEADTSINVKPLYESSKDKEIPKEGLEVKNDHEAYNITFSKHGRDNPNWKDNGKEVTENRLEGAVFKLQIQGPGGIFEDLPGTNVASAFNGYFGFRGLQPGRYRLMEVKAPKGYRPIQDAILYMTIGYTEEDITITDPNTKKDKIIPRGGYITLEYNKNANGIIQYSPEKNATENEGKLVDFVTSATAKNMGKIINEKPGKGEVTIVKKDGTGKDSKLIDGAEFEVRKVSTNANMTNPDETSQEGASGNFVQKGTVGNQTDGDGNIIHGKYTFKDLPIGHYELVETKPADGYQNKGQIWRFTVGGEGLDPYAKDISPTGSDLSSKITFESSDLTVLRPRSEDKTQAEKNSIVHPNLGQQLSFANKFTVADGTEIKPGDYFTLKVNKNLDLEGIVKGRTTGLDIFADGVGTIAKADYNKEAGTITYTFTDYAKTYDLTKFSNVITSYIQTENVKLDQNKVPVGFSLDNTSKETNVNVVYDVDIAEHPVYYYWMNMTSKIVEYDNKTGEFVHYYYINPLGNYSAYNRFQYKPKENVENLRIETYKLTDFSKYNNVMPPSFTVDESSQYLRKTGDVTGKDTINLGTIYGNQGYFIKVTGRAVDKDLESYQAEALLYGPKADGTPAYGAVRNDEVYLQSNKAQASAKLEINAINPENEITFKKVDPDGNILTGAKFALLKKDKNGDWQQVPKSEKPTGTDGLVKYDKLSPGKYGLIETQAPDGFTKLEGVIEEFTVGENGVITRKVEKTVVEKQEENIATRAIKKLQAVFGASDSTDGETPKPVQTEKVDEEVGTRPIEVVNRKEIEFVKVDAADKNKKLANATFELYYKALEADKEYKPYETKVKEGDKLVAKTLTVTSDENGKFTLPISKPGYYALKETEAPDGYTKMPGYIKEFRITLQGKVQTLEKNPGTNLTGKVEGAKDLIGAEVYEVDKDKKSFKERLIINPKFQQFKFDGPDTWLRFLEDDWNISTKDKKIKVAVMEEGQKLEDLTFREVTPGSPLRYDKRIVRYKLSDLYTAANYTGPEPGRSAVTTKKALVVEIEGQLNENKTAADLQSHIYFDLSKLDEIIYKLDFDEEPAYVDLEEEKPTTPGSGSSGSTGTTGGTSTDTSTAEKKYKPIVVENRKAEYPHTGGMGTLIFTLAGILLMSAAAYVYSRKRGESYDE